MIISAPSVFLQPRRHAPPARRSTSQMGIVQPSGPRSHFLRCSGLVHASNTTSRGASTTRIARTSRSLGVSYVVTPVLPAVVVIIGILLLRLHGLEIRVEAVVARVPEAAELVGPVGDLLERGGVERAGAPLRLAAPLDELRALEHAKVLGDGGAAHLEGGGQLLDVRRALGEPGEDRAAGRVGKGEKRCAEWVGGGFSHPL